MLGLTAATYNVDALRNPQMTDTLKSAPWIIRLIKNGVFSLGEVDGIVKKASTDLSQFDSIMAKTPGAQGIDSAERILVISDLHNNPIGLGLALNLAKTYNVKMVLNAGDVTDLGSDFESDFVKQLDAFGVPQVFVAGNHDSVKSIKTISRLRYAVVPNENVVPVEGFRILGQNDPASDTDAGHTMVATNSQISAAKKKLRAIINRQSVKPDILIVHHPEIARRFSGEIPIVVSGHDHTMGITAENGKVWIRPGSTGAAGVRYFSEKNGQPMSAAILYITRKPRVKAIAADLIAITNPNGEFTITRRILK
jgi:predicted phosphodiesterase